MKLSYFDPISEATFGLADDIATEEGQFSITERTIKIRWNRNNKNVHLLVDDFEVVLQPNQMVTVTYLQHVRFEKLIASITAFTF